MSTKYEAFPDFASWSIGALGVSLALVDRATADLDALVQGLDPTDIDLANRRSLLLAALHTGAVEGLHRMNRGVTLTALNNALDWKRIVDDAEGTDARRQVEAALDSFDYAVDAARSEHPTPITEKWIREVHFAACAAQDEVIVTTPTGRHSQPFKRGAYKEYPNHVLLRDGSLHFYSPPESVAPEMHRFVSEVRGESFQSAHSVYQAAYLHHVFTWIHPFQDGNGRVARVLASVPLLRSASIPFHVYEDQVGDYFAALEAADRGAQSHLIRFVADRVLDLAQLTADRLAADNTAVGAIDPVRLNLDRARASAAQRVLALLSEVLDEVTFSVETPRSVIAERRLVTDDVTGYSDGSSVVGGQEHEGLVFTIEGTERARWLWFPVALPRHDHPDDEIVLVGREPADRLSLRVTDLYPEIKVNARNRIEAHVQRRVVEALASLVSDGLVAPPLETHDGGTV